MSHLHQLTCKKPRKWGKDSKNRSLLQQLSVYANVIHDTCHNLVENILYGSTFNVFPKYCKKVVKHSSKPMLPKNIKRRRKNICQKLRWSKSKNIVHMWCEKKHRNPDTQFHKHRDKGKKLTLEVVACQSQGIESQVLWYQQKMWRCLNCQQANLN